LAWGIYPPSPRIPPYYRSKCQNRGDNPLHCANKILGKKLPFFGRGINPHPLESFPKHDPLFQLVPNSSTKIFGKFYVFMTMEKEDNTKSMIFRYLNELFKNINIEEMELPKFQIGMIPIDTGKKYTAVQGMVGNTSVFTYLPESNTITFDKHEYKTMANLFGVNSREGIGYVKSYLIKNIDGVPDDVTIYIG
jgi:hypothetical protein